MRPTATSKTQHARLNREATHGIHPGLHLALAAAFTDHGFGAATARSEAVLVTQANGADRVISSKTAVYAGSADSARNAAPIGSERTNSATAVRL
jgi:hypothetical protein